MVGPVSSISGYGTKDLTASQHPWTIRVIAVRVLVHDLVFATTNSIVDWPTAVRGRAQLRDAVFQVVAGGHQGPKCNRGALGCGSTQRTFCCLLRSYFTIY